MSVARHGVASAVLNGKLYAIGGVVHQVWRCLIHPQNSWSAGVSLPSEVNHGTAITVNEKIFLVGGKNASNQIINQVLCFDPYTNQWQAKANILLGSSSACLVG